jgi:hypothetical protein
MNIFLKEISYNNINQFDDNNSDIVDHYNSSSEYHFQKNYNSLLNYNSQEINFLS